MCRLLPGPLCLQLRAVQSMCCQIYSFSVSCSFPQACLWNEKWRDSRRCCALPHPVWWLQVTPEDTVLGGRGLSILSAQRTLGKETELAGFALLSCLHPRSSSITEQRQEVPRRCPHTHTPEDTHSMVRRLCLVDTSFAGEFYLSV